MSGKVPSDISAPEELEQHLFDSSGSDPNESEPRYPAEPVAGSGNADFANRFRDVLEPLLRSGLLEPSSKSKINNNNLHEVIRSLDHAIKIVNRLTSPVSNPFEQHPRILDVLGQLRTEVSRLRLGIESEVLRVPDNVLKDKRWADPRLIRLRYACVGYGDVLSKRCSKAAADRMIAEVLKQNNRPIQPDTIKKWRSQFATVLDNRHRLCARYDLSEQLEHLKSMPVDKLTLDSATSLELLNERLQIAIRRDFAKA